MQQRLADLREINSMQTRWDQGLALDEYRKKWAMQRKKTRRYCHRCGCVLYVRSATDTVPDEKDLDEVYFSPHGQTVSCFSCHTSPLTPLYGTTISLYL